MDNAGLTIEFPEMEILTHEPLMKYTYTKTGGPADYLVFPKTQHEVQQIVTYCTQHTIPWLVLGNASNLIVRDGGIRGVVLMLTKMTNMTIDHTTIQVEAGARLIDVSKAAGEHQLTGLEFACGIPGSIGGAVYMNAGAYGGEIKDVFVSCDYLDETGTIRTLTAADMAFSYRHSAVQEKKGIVLSVTFELQQGVVQEIQEKMQELTRLREDKQPLEYPSCGSVFKRPEGHFTGKLIQDAGLQGMCIGGAQISTKHAGFIVNIDHATATDYVELIVHIQHVIFEKFAVSLETEVRIIGEQ
ncbi:UDP-N-acetylenolpyruvoylglucosamine reductase [Enterococcus sp. AZ150]|uniref:UDP-N-acetylmuramate dehydrogenase n=1 Tax=Enterococcus sp. AZ150 TaxID=2774866 RepID=UPI003F264434